ncbi:MAG: recombinase family protein [Myxococcaceae bacterium]
MRVFGYARVSTEGQEDNTSLPMQRERIAAFAKAQGWTPPEIVEEVGSGASIHRLGLQQLRGRLMHGDTLVVLRLDRLFRSVVDGLPFFKEMESRGVAIRSVTEQIDTGSPMGRLMLTMILAFATAERELILERLASGKRRNADEGHFNGGRAPFGYVRVLDGEDDFAVVVEEAKVVKQLFTLYASGRFGLARLRKAAGCSLSESAIAGILSNPFYCGLLRWGATVKPNRHAAIVSRRLFAEVQRVRTARAEKAPRLKVPETLAEDASACSPR